MSAVVTSDVAMQPPCLPAACPGGHSLQGPPAQIFRCMPGSPSFVLSFFSSFSSREDFSPTRGAGTTLSSEESRCGFVASGFASESVKRTFGAALLEFEFEDEALEACAAAAVEAAGALGALLWDALALDDAPEVLLGELAEEAAGAGFAAGALGAGALGALDEECWAKITEENRKNVAIEKPESLIQHLPPTAQERVSSPLLIVGRCRPPAG